MVKKKKSISDDVHRPTQVDSDQPLVRPGRVPPDVVEALEHDLCEQCFDPGTTESSSSVLASMVPTQRQGMSASTFVDEGREESIRVGVGDRVPKHPSRFCGWGTTPCH